MTDIINNYGKNAGKVWKTLEKCGPCNSAKIMKTTGLNKEEFYIAIGWLAKENKIWFDENNYAIGSTIWNDYIGTNAGKVWNILNTCPEIDATYIPKLAGFSEKDAYYAIGWLAKEGKISGKKIIPKKPQIKLWLK